MPTTASRATIAQRLRSLRKQRGLTRTQLADLARVQAPTLHRWESGEADHISTTLLARVCSALGVPMSDIIRDEQAAPRPRKHGERLSLTVEHHLPKLYRAMAIALTTRAKAAALVLAAADEKSIERATDAQINALLALLGEAEHHRTLMQAFDPNASSAPPVTSKGGDRA